MIVPIRNNHYFTIIEIRKKKFYELLNSYIANSDILIQNPSFELTNEPSVDFTILVKDLTNHQESRLTEDLKLAVNDFKKKHILTDDQKLKLSEDEKSTLNFLLKKYSIMNKYYYENLI